jgi:hypothetical protein
MGGQGWPALRGRRIWFERNFDDHPVEVKIYDNRRTGQHGVGFVGNKVHGLQVENWVFCREQQSTGAPDNQDGNNISANIGVDSLTLLAAYVVRTLRHRAKKFGVQRDSDSVSVGGWIICFELMPEKQRLEELNLQILGQLVEIGYRRDIA